MFDIMAYFRNGKIPHHSILTSIKWNMAAQLGIPDATLVAVLANPPPVEVCFLCATSNGAECVWGKVGNDIIGYGCAKGIHYEDRDQMH